VLKFVDIKHGDEKDEDPFIAKKIVIPNGVYKDIEELISAINIRRKSAESHFYFRQRNAIGGKIDIQRSCENDRNYKNTHYVSFSNNLLRIFGLKANIAHHVSLKICKSNPIVHNTLIFIKLGFLANAQTRIISFWSRDSYSLWRDIPINHSFIMMFVRLI